MTERSVSDVSGVPSGAPVLPEGGRPAGVWAGLGYAVCVAIALWHIAAAIQLPARMGYFLGSQIQLGISLACALVAVFLINPGRRTGPIALGLAALLTALALASIGNMVFRFDTILMYAMMGSLDQTGVILALCLVVPLMEALRRKAGMILPLVILALVGVVVFQPYLPGILYGRGYSIERLLYSTYVGTYGIFGLPLRVAAEIIIVFIIFGALISASGAGRWFLDLALILSGRKVGGPAKAAVLASAFFGSFSGSPSANAASTGVLTIPLMKRVGYQPKFAGAVEAVASTSGQILPPVMGAIAFVMAEWTGNTYAQIVKIAAIPAILYILIIYASVHFQARRQQIPLLDRSTLPALRDTLRSGWYYFVPLAVLCGGLFYFNLPPQLSAAISLPVIILVSFLSPDRGNWLTPWRIADALVESVHNWKGIAVITGSVGIMIGAMVLSGVGIRISDFIIDLSGGNLVVLLIMIGVAALILGMGLDAIPAYITLATLLAPALISVGVSTVGAHFYVVYWGLASFFTPPLCIAVFVTSGIARSGVWETGWEAVRLGIGAFLVPIAFVLEPALLLDGTPAEIVLATLTALCGAVLLSAAMRGFALAPLTPAARVLLGLSGICLIAPGVVLPGIGLVTAAGIVIVQKAWPNLALVTAPYPGAPAGPATTGQPVRQ